MIEFRRAKPEDAQALLDYIKLVGAETDFLTMGAEGLPLTVEEEAAYLEHMSQSDRSIMIVAEEDGKILGTAHLAASSRKRLRHRASIGISVLKSHWGRGIGTQLMQRLLDHAHSIDVEVLDLEVISSNERAVKLYEKFGFVHQGCWQKFMRVGDEYYDALIMQRFLVERS